MLLKKKAIEHNPGMDISVIKAINLFESLLERAERKAESLAATPHASKPNPVIELDPPKQEELVAKLVEPQTEESAGW